MDILRSLYMIGFTHRTSAVELREKLAITHDLLPQAYEELQTISLIQEVIIVSTCNRTELYCVATANPYEALQEFLCTFRNVAPADLQAAVCHQGRDVCAHILKVASGLDSMVLGEPQIFGQVKSAYYNARKLQAVNRTMNHFFQFVFSQVKDIRANIPLGQQPVSIAYTAVRLVKQVFEKLKDKRLLLIGSGETIELVARYLVDSGVSNLVIANRTLERAEEIASKYRGRAVALYEIPEQLPQCDIVISATASQLPILGKGIVEQAKAKRPDRTMLLLDLAMPRDIEPQVQDIHDVYLYSIDDFRTIIESNQKSRKKMAQVAHKHIESRVEKFVHSVGELSSLQAIISYRENAQAIRDDELEKAMRQLKRGIMPESVLYSLAHRLTGKLLHTPSIKIRQAGARGRKDIVDAAAELFDAQNSHDTLSH